MQVHKRLDVSLHATLRNIHHNRFDHFKNQDEQKTNWFSTILDPICEKASRNKLWYIVIIFEIIFNKSKYFLLGKFKFILTKVYDPVSVCSHFFIFSSIDKANNKKTVR